jgi:fatty-acyl-CoA synthase
VFVPLTPLRFLHRAIDLFGSRVGIVCGKRKFTYAEFGARCERLASGLRKNGVVPGDRVGYLSFNTHKLLEGYYGVVQAGGIVMPLNVRLSESELAMVLNHSGAAMLMFEDDFAPVVERLRAQCPTVKRWVNLDGRGELSYDEIVDQGSAERADVFAVDEMSIAELFYTSGSTGTPKGVALSHRTLYLHALDAISIYRDFETMVDLHTIPLFHANGWGRPQASTMLGTRQVMVRRFEPNSVLQLIQEHRATDLCMVPAMANALVNAPDLAQYDTSSLRRVMIGGAANSAELVARVEAAFPTCECVSGYGLTETSPILTISQSKREASAYGADRCKRQAMTGGPTPGVQVRVVDPQMRDVPRDMETMGEVIAAGDHIMEGYFREPEATAAAMSGPWFHTGDMAVWDHDGFIQIVDRKKEVIISGGENISSIEVEKAIFAHPSVLECAVVAAPDDRWGEVPAAIIVCKPGMTLTSEELSTFLEGKLARYKMPRMVEFRDAALPKTGTGKIRKVDLREQFWAGKEKRVQG